MAAVPQIVVEGPEIKVSQPRASPYDHLTWNGESRGVAGGQGDFQVRLGDASGIHDSTKREQSVVFRHACRKGEREGLSFVVKNLDRILSGNPRSGGRAHSDRDG